MEFDINFDDELEFSVDISDENQVGEYTIQILGSIDEGPQVGDSASFRFSVLVEPGGVIPENTAPYFLTPLPP